MDGTSLLLRRRLASPSITLDKLRYLSKSVPPMWCAEANAFALSNDDIVHRLCAKLRLRDRRIRLSTLPVATTTDVLNNMQVVEAVRFQYQQDLA